MWLKFLPLILLMACASNRNAEPAKNANDISRLHDIWALETINGENVPKDLSKRPVLELFVKDKKMIGNDGCNSISGPLKAVNETELRFGMMMGTKMACPNMAFSSSYNSNLDATRFYVLKGLTLILQDENKQELMTFKKVD